MKAWRSWQTLLACIATGMVAIVLYWPTLRLPLIYDTLLHIRISGDLNLVSVWLPTADFGFYRPMTFFPLILVRQLFDGYPNWLLHGMNVVQHGVNAALLTWLVWRLWGKLGRATLSGLLFAVFPFSYQAVAVYGHNVHPSLVGLILLGLHTYLQARRTNKALWWVLTALVFALGLLTHESVILFGVLAGLMQIADPVWGLVSADWSKRRQTMLSRRFWLPPATFTLAGLAYFVVYQFLPITRAPQVASDVGALWEKGLYLLQAAAYPLTWLAQWLDSFSAETIIFAAIVITVLLTIYAWRRFWPALVFGWGWWLLASVLIAIPLPASYLTRGPRLLYLGSVGLALVWPVLLEALLGKRATTEEIESTEKSVQNPHSSAKTMLSVIPFFAGIAFLIIIFVANWVFVRDRLQAYTQLTASEELMETTLVDRPADEGVIVVNFPQWTAPERNMYPLGAEFVQQLGDYLFFEEWLDHNLGGNRPNAAVQLDELLSDSGYGYGIHNQVAWDAINWENDNNIFVTRYTPDGPIPEWTGRIMDVESAELMGQIGPYGLVSADAVVCDGVVSAEITLHPASEIPSTLSLFAQVLDANGQLVAQIDRPPLSLRPELLKLNTNQQIIDHRSITLPANTVAQTLLIGAYNFVTEDRFPATGATGATLNDNAFPLSLTPCPASN